MSALVECVEVVLLVPVDQASEALHGSQKRVTVDGDEYREACAKGLRKRRFESIKFITGGHRP